MSDLSQLSDEELLKMADAPEGDLSSLSDEELLAMAPPEPAPEQSFGEKAANYAVSAIPVATSLAGGAVGSLAGPAGSVAGGAAGYAGGNQVEKYIREKMMGQKQAPTTPMEVGKDLAVGTLGGVGGLAMKAGAKMLPKAAQMFATSPLPGKIAKATDIGGKMGGLAGKAGAYAIPGVQKVQAFSDTMKYGVGGAQKGVAYLLDHAPESLGKYLAPLKAASERGAAGVATMDFLLSQRDKNYQKLKKDLSDGGVAGN